MFSRGVFSAIICPSNFINNLNYIFSEAKFHIETVYEIRKCDMKFDERDTVSIEQQAHQVKITDNTKMYICINV